MDTSDASDSVSVAECLKTLSHTMTAFTETVKKIEQDADTCIQGVPKRMQRLLKMYISLVYSSAARYTTGKYDVTGLDTVRHLAAQHKNMVPAYMLANIDVFNDSFKMNILQGRNVKFASLLITFNPVHGQRPKMGQSSEENVYH